VTHKVSILSQLDEIIVLRMYYFRIRALQELLPRKGAFAEFLVEY